MKLSREFLEKNLKSLKYSFPKNVVNIIYEFESNKEYNTIFDIYNSIEYYKGLRKYATNIGMLSSLEGHYDTKTYNKIKKELEINKEGNEK